MSERRTVLVLDLDEEELNGCVLRLRRLRLPLLHAKTWAEAERLVDAEGERVGAVLFAPGLVDTDLPPLLERLGAHLLHPPVLVTVGRPPEAERRERLRAAGVEYALWDPFDDRTLRFVVNEALAPADARGGRGGVRIPTGLEARVETGGRTKGVHAYSLSTTGAYLETARPSMRGARLVMEITLPDGLLRAAARVVFANVPGNLQRPNLPLGMGVRFEDLDPAEATRLRRYVESCAAAISV